MVSKRSDTVCNFLEESKTWGKDIKLIYRHYATLYFIFAVDDSESELGILDLIQVFVEALDKSFENVCELDLIFHTDKVLFMIFSAYCHVAMDCRAFERAILHRVTFSSSTRLLRYTIFWTRSSWAVQYSKQTWRKLPLRSTVPSSMKKYHGIRKNAPVSLVPRSKHCCVLCYLRTRESYVFCITVPSANRCGAVISELASETEPDRFAKCSDKLMLSS